MRKQAAPKVLDLSSAIKYFAKRGADLGDGYYLIQVDRPQPGGSGPRHEMHEPHGFKMPGVAALDPAEIEDVLSRLKRRGTRVAQRPLKHQATPEVDATWDQQEANRALLADFAAKEQASVARLAAQGALIDSQTMADRLAVTRQAVNKAVNELRMFALEGAGGTRLIPSFFADAELDRKKLESVCRALDQLPGSSKWQFFTTPRLQLGKKTPLEALRKGKFEQVMAAATAFAEA